MKQRELAESIYGEENHTLNILDELKKKLETEEIIIRHDDRHTYDSLADSALSVLQTSRSTMLVSRPTVVEVEKYLQEWANLESYKLQETALDRLFFELSPKNTDISDILLKVATLNDFYSTNIFFNISCSKTYFIT